MRHHSIPMSFIWSTAISPVYAPQPLKLQFCGATRAPLVNLSYTEPMCRCRGLGRRTRRTPARRVVLWRLNVRSCESGVPRMRVASWRCRLTRVQLRDGYAPARGSTTDASRIREHSSRPTTGCCRQVAFAQTGLWSLGGPRGCLSP